MTNTPEKIAYVDAELITPSPYQYRRQMSEEKLLELTASIEEHGVLQPVLIRYVRGKIPELVAGHRRWQAAIRAGLKRIPAIVKELTDIQAAEIALIENVQREDPDDWSTALGLKALLDLHAKQGVLLSDAKLARQIKMSVTFVRNHLGLFKLEPKLQEVAQRHNNVKSSLFQIQKVVNTDHLESLIKDIDSGASFKKIEGRVQRILEEEEHKRESNRPPDNETAARTRENTASGGGQMSRGRMVTGSKASEARGEVQRHLAGLEAWLPHLSKADYEKYVATFARRLLRGDLTH